MLAQVRRRATRSLVLAAVLAVAVAGVALAEKPIVVKVGNVVVTFNGGVTPKKLPRNTLAPIAFTASGKVKTSDGSHLPALEKVVIEADRNSAINAKGLAVCTSGKLQAQDTPHAEKICKEAIVGKGITNVEVAFPESTPFIAKSRLLAFNGGVRGGKTTIFVHAYLSAPVSAAIVTTVQVSKIHKGRFGLKSVASIPKIAGGYGSVKEFSLTINRSFTYKGKKQSYLLAKCPDGHLNAYGTAFFGGGPTVSAEIVRSCTPKG
jgi:hypothetical protein